MRPQAFLAALLLAGCAGPRPCTQTLCLSKLEGSYEVRGWSGAVTVTPEAPRPPVASDSDVSILSGEAEFINGRASMKAAAGTTFRFSVSTRTAAFIEVSSGTVAVIVSSAVAPTNVRPGGPYSLPVAK